MILRAYHILGVHQSASPREIKAAFIEKSRKCHPDRNPSPCAAKQFDEIHHVYTILKDKDKRMKYDSGILDDPLCNEDLQDKLRYIREEHDRERARMKKEKEDRAEKFRRDEEERKRADGEQIQQQRLLEEQRRQLENQQRVEMLVSQQEEQRKMQEEEERRRKEEQDRVSGSTWFPTMSSFTINRKRQSKETTKRGIAKPLSPTDRLPRSSHTEHDKTHYSHAHGSSLGYRMPPASPCVDQLQKTVEILYQEVHMLRDRVEMLEQQNQRNVEQVHSHYMSDQPNY